MGISVMGAKNRCAERKPKVGSNSQTVELCFSFSMKEVESII